MIKAILIDDEQDSLSSLKYTIQEYCPQLDIIASYTSPIKALEAIKSLHPDIVFLDIEMPEMTGFQLLENIKELSVFVIFTTAFQKYAVQAIKYSALDYLLKPIDGKDLVVAIERYYQQKQKISIEQFQFLIDRLAQKENTLQKLAIPNLEGFRLINVQDIIYCKADGNYSHIYLKGKVKILATRSIGDIQELLEEFGGFLRIHHGYLVNYREVQQYIRGEGGQLIMSDGSEVTVSRNKKEILIKYINKLK